MLTISTDGNTSINYSMNLTNPGVDVVGTAFGTSSSELADAMLRRTSHGDSSGFRLLGACACSRSVKC